MKHLYSIKTVAEFLKDLEFFLKFYKPIGLPDLLHSYSSGNSVQKKIFLSFDDGLSECYHVVAPILKKKGIPATFFLNSGFIDNQDLFYRYKASLLIEELHTKPVTIHLQKKIGDILTISKTRIESFRKRILSIGYNEISVLDQLADLLELDFKDYLLNNKPYMNSSQIESLISDGFTIGAHSIDHPRYADVSIDEQRRQTIMSLVEVQTRFKLSYKTFAFPFTDYGVSKYFFESVLDPSKGFTDLSFGSAGLKKDYLPSHMQRFPMEGSLLSPELLVGNEYVYYILKGLLGKILLNAGKWF